MGPHPYPWMVREFHRVIGDEARVQCKELIGGDPDVVVACVGGGSNASVCSPGSSTPTPRLVGVEPAGGAAVGRGVPGVVHGMRSYLMQDEYGQVEEAQSISAGLDYPGVGPNTPTSTPSGGPSTRSVSDDEVLEAFTLLARTEGIIAAFESPSHRLGGPRSPVTRRPDRARQPVGPATRTSPRRWSCWAESPRWTIIEEPFTAAKANGRKLLVPYITGGYPGWADAVRGRGRRSRRGRDRHPLLRSR